MARKKKNNNKKNRIETAFNAVKDKVLKTSPGKELDNIDKALNRISDAIVNKDTMNQAEMLRNIFSSSLKNDTFKNITAGNLTLSAELVDRIVRYMNADEIVDSIPFCSRALKVLTNEIISPDNITKEMLQFLHKKKLSEEDTRAFENVKAINDVLKIDESLHDLVFETLKMGDQFIEICDYTSEEVPIMQTVLNENGVEIPEEPCDIVFEDVHINEFGKEEITKRTVEVTPTITEAINKKDETIDIDKIRLVIHDPSFVVKLQSQRFKMELGYLILPRPPTSAYSSVMYPASRSNTTNIAGLQFSSTAHDLTGVDKLYIDVMEKIKKHIGNEEISVDKKEVKSLLSKALKEFDQEKKLEFKIRYVPPARMEHFKLSSRRFFPYGEGIFYRTTFSAKLLIAFEIALVIKRISDSSDKRAIYVEQGLPRNVRNVIEEIKEALHKRKFSFDTLGNIGSIPSMITSYETYFLPQNKGKRFVEFDQLPAAINIRDIADELKFFRDTLVSALDVPPSYLNLEENLSNKNALTFENQLFARTVVGYQTMLSKHIRNLFNKIYRMVYGKLVPIGINITFFPPRMLELERETEHIETISRLITAFKELGINEEYLKRKYLSIDWDELKEFETESEMDKKIKPPKPEEGGGGYGAGGY